jgi:predicted histone-like DNA-binding protein
MAVKNPQFEINIRKNINANNPGYGKYYPKAVEKETISLRGLCKHMAEHNSIYGRDIIQGVLMKMSSCIAELLSQGNPVKIDGLGTFVPTIESARNGITREELLAGKWNPQLYIKAVHIRFRPENGGTPDEKLTSRAFKDQCVFEAYQLVETKTKVIDGKTKTYQERTPLATYGISQAEPDEP